MPVAWQRAMSELTAESQSMAPVLVWKRVAHQVSGARVMRLFLV